MTEFTEQESATLARIEAAQDAEESLRERVALSLRRAAYAYAGDEARGSRAYWLHLADAALSVVRGDPS